MAASQTDIVGLGLGDRDRVEALSPRPVVSTDWYCPITGGWQAAVGGLEETAVQCHAVVAQEPNEPKSRIC
jgi:hypothetical protein